MRLLPLLLLGPLAANALHFYLDKTEKKCFLEELPVNTMVEGAPGPICPAVPCAARRTRAALTEAEPRFCSSAGHYSAFEWSDDNQDFMVNPELGIQVTVSVCLLPRLLSVGQKNGSKGGRPRQEVEAHSLLLAPLSRRRAIDCLGLDTVADLPS